MHSIFGDFPWCSIGTGQMALNKNQKAFCDYFKSSNNMVESYFKAFPRCKNKTSASAAASRLLRTNQDVQNYMSAIEVQATQRAIKKAEISKERVLSEESSIAFLDPADILDENGSFKDLKDIPEQVRRSIKKIIETTVAGVRTVRIEFYDKGKSLDRLEKCLKMQSDGIDVTGGLTLKLIIENIDGKGRGKLPQDS